MWFLHIVFFNSLILLIHLLPGNQKFFPIGMGKNVIWFASAHPARTMYFPFCETSCFPSRPGEYIFFSAKLSKNMNFPVNNTFPLWTPVCSGFSHLAKPLQPKLYYTSIELSATILNSQTAIRFSSLLLLFTPTFFIAPAHPAWTIKNLPKYFLNSRTSYWISAW